jgi:hypothetical protein
MNAAEPANSAVLAAEPPGLDPHLLRIALVIILGSFMSVLDTTIINVAMRELSRTFHVTLAVTQWVTTGYSLALVTTIPLAGGRSVTRCDCLWT